MTTTAVPQLSKAEILEALEAIDLRAIESVNAHREGRQAQLVPLPRAAQEALDTASDDETYEDLPEPVLAIFKGDKEGNDGIGSENEDTTKDKVGQYRDGSLTKEELEAQLETKDDKSVKDLKDQLAKSRENLADELAKCPSDVQQKGLNGRQKSNGGFTDWWQSISDEVSSWFKKIVDEVVDWFKGAFKSIADFFMTWFKF
ncbi:hypothetical protein [Streptomyces sp. NPDC059247]|uniref:hypothetical protein n=1 Tax=Streptomyces sp. NPDC059247 TaxID=3346790 RepID=UPI003678C9C0